MDEYVIIQIGDLDDDVEYEFRAIAIRKLNDDIRRYLLFQAAKEKVCGRCSCKASWQKSSFDNVLFKGLLNFCQMYFMLSEV